MPATSSQKLGAAARTAAPLMVSDKLSPDAQKVFGAVYDVVQGARLTGDTKREATSSEVAGLRHENEQLKQVVAELLLKNRVLKKSATDRETSAWDD